MLKVIGTTIETTMLITYPCPSNLMLFRLLFKELLLL